MSGVDLPELVAQPAAVRALEALLAAGRAHALLLAGAPGSGPRAAATLVGRRVLCPAGGDDGCEVCRRVERRVHPDLVWVAPEGGRLAIDQVRAVLETVSRMPFEAAAQVVVIENAETLSSDNKGVGDSLLKALEEPAGRVVFVLVATRSQPILPTIRSRSIEVPFPPIADPLLVRALAASGIDDATAASACGLDLHGVARAARGDLERALSLARGGDDCRRRAELLPSLQAVVARTSLPSELADAVLTRAEQAGAVAAAAAAEAFAAMLERMSPAEQRTFQAKSNDQGVEKRTARRARRARVAELQACLDELAGWWRDVLALRVDAPEAVTNVDCLDALADAARRPAGAAAVFALDAIDDAGARLRLNNADEPVTVAALAADFAALAEGRVRPSLRLGSGARTGGGYQVALA